MPSHVDGHLDMFMRAHANALAHQPRMHQLRACRIRTRTRTHIHRRMLASAIAHVRVHAHFLGVRRIERSNTCAVSCQMELGIKKGHARTMIQGLASLV